MTDHEAELATLHQEATQQRARIKRLEAALCEIAHSAILPHVALRQIARDALWESSE